MRSLLIGLVIGVCVYLITYFSSNMPMWERLSEMERELTKMGYKINELRAELEAKRYPHWGGLE